MTSPVTLSSVKHHEGLHLCAGMKLCNAKMMTATDLIPTSFSDIFIFHTSCCVQYSIPPSTTAYLSPLSSVFIYCCSLLCATFSYIPLCPALYPILLLFVLLSVYCSLFTLFYVLFTMDCTQFVSSRPLHCVNYSLTLCHSPLHPVLYPFPPSSISLFFLYYIPCHDAVSMACNNEYIYLLRGESIHMENSHLFDNRTFTRFTSTFGEIKDREKDFKNLKVMCNVHNV